MRAIAKTGGGLFQFTVALDIDIERAVRQYVRDLIVGEERFERTKPDHVVTEIGGKRHFFELIELDPLLSRDFVDQICNFDAQNGARDAAGHGGIDARHHRRADSLSQRAGQGQMGVGRRGFLSEVRDKDKTRATQLGEAGSKAGRTHQKRLHHGFRSDARPEISAARAETASVNPPRLATPGAVKSLGRYGITKSGRSLTLPISSKVIAPGPPSPRRLTTRKLRRFPSRSPSASRSRTVSRTARSVWSATITRTSAISSTWRHAVGIRGTSAIM